MSNFFEGLGSKLSERWLDYLFSPALIFYGAGALVLYLRYGGAFRSWVTARSEAVQLVVIAASLLLVIQSAVLMERFAGQVLAWLCGSWPRFLSRLANWRKSRHTSRYEGWWNEFQKTNAGLLEQKLDQYPPNPEDIQPTLLGNILLAAERFPRDKYGLDPAACWSALWLVLPETTRSAVSEARRRLDGDVVSISWGVLTLAWALVDWRILPLPVIWIWLSYQQALQSARSYGLIFRAAFDLHRLDLYNQLNWPVPLNTSEEQGCGAKLSQYLYRGSTKGTVVFEKPEK